MSTDPQGLNPGIKSQMTDTVTNVANTVGTAAQSTTLLVNTGVTKGLGVANKTLRNSLETTQNILDAANDSVQKAVKVGTEGIQSASKIAIQGTHSTEAITRDGLNLAVGVSGKTADVTNSGLEVGADVTKKGLEVGADVTKKGLEVGADVTKRVLEVGANITDDGLQSANKVTKATLTTLGDVTQQSILLTGNSLSAMLGSVNNMVSRRQEKITAKNESDKIKKGTLVYDEIKRETLIYFKAKMDDFTNNFKTMVNNQINLLNSSLSIYKLGQCTSGRVYGYNCSKDINNQFLKFKTDIKIIKSRSENNIKSLETIIAQYRTNISAIPTENPSDYAKILDELMLNSFTSVIEIFKTTLQEFQQLSDSINNQSASGGRKKRKTQLKKSRKSRKSRKNSKNRTH